MHRQCPTCPEINLQCRETFVSLSGTASTGSAELQLCSLFCAHLQESEASRSSKSSKHEAHILNRFSSDKSGSGQQSTVIQCADGGVEASSLSIIQPHPYFNAQTWYLRRVRLSQIHICACGEVIVERELLPSALSSFRHRGEVPVERWHCYRHSEASHIALHQLAHD